LPEGWLNEHPLTARDLAAEVSQQKGAGFSLEIA